ncbi:MAG: bleomycin resistance protein [Bacteroidetes bacterium OLB9]|nr:MAG: bleomycin resistance protein [Bacteroidetes bacterium OLB9]
MGGNRNEVVRSNINVQSKEDNIMLTNINPKLPMRDKNATKDFYLTKLGFIELGDYGDYLLIKKDGIEIHFFEFKDLDPKENYGQVYIRTNDIDNLYQSFLDNKIDIHPNGKLQTKPWGQKEFSVLDPDSNLLTFGQSI